MNWEIITTIILAVLTIAGTFISYYFYIKSILEKSANAAIDDAEVPGKIGAEKLEEAAVQLFMLVPAVLKAFITKDVCKSIAQAAFDKIEAYSKKQSKKEK